MGREYEIEPRAEAERLAARRQIKLKDKPPNHLSSPWGGGGGDIRSVPRGCELFIIYSYWILIELDKSNCRYRDLRPAP